MTEVYIGKHFVEGSDPVCQPVIWGIWTARSALEPLKRDWRVQQTELKMSDIAHVAPNEIIIRLLLQEISMLAKK